MLIPLWFFIIQKQYNINSIFMVNIHSHGFKNQTWSAGSFYLFIWFSVIDRAGIASSSNRQTRRSNRWTGRTVQFCVNRSCLIKILLGFSFFWPTPLLLPSPISFMPCSAMYKQFIQLIYFVVSMRGEGLEIIEKKFYMGRIWRPWSCSRDQEPF